MTMLLVIGCSSKKDMVKKSSVLDAEAVFAQAKEKEKDGYYEEARKLLESIKVQDTSGKYAIVAQIRIADTYYKEELFEEAIIEYGHFLRVHPYNKYASYAQYKLGMSYFSRIKTADVSYSLAQKALDEFEKLLRVYPRNPYINMVENRIRMCKGVLAEHEFYVGQFYYKKGSYNAAAGRFKVLIQKYPHSKKGAEALYYLGLSYKEIGETEKSLNALNTLIDKYPTIKLARDAKKLIAAINKHK